MISAIILAAGDSTRMGEAKLLMPWGKGTVLETVLSTLQEARIADLLVVTGGGRQRIESVIHKTARTIFNEAYARGGMLGSLQLGLKHQLPEASAALVCLGDQPQVQARTVRTVCEAYRNTRSQIIVPSHQMRRGHPWLLARPLWGDFLALKSPKTPRNFLGEHASDIQYVEIDSSSVIEDLDTPEDYRKFRPAV